MAWIYRPKGKHIYMVGYYDHRGQLVRESTGTTSEKRAQTIAKAKDTDKDRGLPVAAGVGKILFGTVSTASQPATGAVALIENDYHANHYTSWPEVAGRIRLHLDPVFGGARMAEITGEHIAAYIAQRRAAGAAPAQVNRELAVLRRMFVLCVQQGRLLYRPAIGKLRERNARAGFFERLAFERVCVQLPDYWRPVVRFAYITGWRVKDEVLKLEWRHVDFDADEVRLFADETKNGEPRVFPMTDDLRELLTDRAQAARALAVVTPRVFFRVVAGRPRALKDPRHAWRVGCQAAGERRLVHDFRRTAVRNMVRLGVPERVAMQMCGHLTRTVFERYNIVSPADLTAAARRLDGVAPNPVKNLTITSQKSDDHLSDGATPNAVKNLTITSPITSQAKFRVAARKG